MKLLTTTILAILLLVPGLISTSAVAGTNDGQLKIRLRDGQVQLLYANLERQKVYIKITNNYGKVVHNDQVDNQLGFIRSYDFSKLDEGFYTFEVTNRDQTLKREISFLKKASMALVKQGEDSYRLLYGTRKKSKVTVELINKKGKVVFTDKILSENGFSKTYKVSPENTNATRIRVITQYDTKEFELQ